MVEFVGEGLILDGSSFSIHWLIWIQLIVFLLILLLLYSLSSSAPIQYDPPSSSSSSSPSSSSVLPSSSHILISTTTTSSSSSYRRSQKKELEEEEMEANIDRDRRKGGRVEMEMERETGGSAGKESGSGLAEVTHPCHIVRLARMAFLKCFGLGAPPPRR